MIQLKLYFILFFLATLYACNFFDNPDTNSAGIEKFPSVCDSSLSKKENANLFLPIKNGNLWIYHYSIQSSSQFRYAWSVRDTSKYVSFEISGVCSMNDTTFFSIKKNISVYNVHHKNGIYATTTYDTTYNPRASSSYSYYLFVIGLDTYISNEINSWSLYNNEIETGFIPNPNWNLDSLTKVKFFNDSLYEYIHLDNPNAAWQQHYDTYKYVENIGLYEGNHSNNNQFQKYTNRIELVRFNQQIFNASLLDTYNDF